MSRNKRNRKDATSVQVLAKNNTSPVISKEMKKIVTVQSINIGKDDRSILSKTSTQVSAQFSTNKIDILWKIINRFDLYIDATNTKAGIFIGFNTFVFTGIILKMEDLLPKGHYIFSLIAEVFLMVAAIASLISLWKIFKAINPYLYSPNESLSNIFCNHIATRKSAEEYIKCIKEMGEESFIDDLGVQTYTIAKGLKEKFKLMGDITSITLYGQVTPLTLTIIIKMAWLIIDIIKGVK